MRSLAFVIHDLNPWGGQDKSVLEIARRLSRRWPVEIHSYTFEDPRGRGEWGDVSFHPVKPGIKRPAAAKFSWFQLATPARLRVGPRLRGKQPPLVFAVGACSLVSDVVQLQFVHAEWKEREARLPPGACEAPFSRGRAGGGALARYQAWLQGYNLMTERAAFTRGKRYIAISRGVALELERHFGIPGAEVIHHGVDSEEFRPHWESAPAERESTRARLGIAPGDVAFALVGAFERKGLATAIQALARLSPEARARARLVAVGGGAEEGFRRLAREQGVADRVSFAPPTREVAPVYSACDAFVLPTYYEPFGLVILEAMASGLPPVVSASAGASELIEDGESGWLLSDPTDVFALARALERVALDDGERRRVGERAREAARTRSWDRVAEEYARVLEPMLESGARGSGEGA